MSENFDGTSADPAVQFAVGNPTLLDPLSFEDSDEFEYLNDSGETVTVTELIDSTPSTSRIKTGRLILSGTPDIYDLLANREIDAWFLVKTGTIKEDTGDGQSVQLDKSGLIKYLKSLLYLCEKNHHYLSQSVRLHKEAVQDTVDIVQSKRIDFLETKDKTIDVSGVFITLLITLVFELGLAAAAASAVKQVASNIAQSVVTSKLMKNILQWAYHIVGKQASQNTFSAIQQLKNGQVLMQAELTELENMLVTVNSRFAQINNQKSNIRLFQQIRIRDQQTAIQNQVTEIEALTAQVSREQLIQRGKELVTQIRVPIDEAIGQLNKLPNIEKPLGKDSSNVVNNRVKGKEIEHNNASINQLPIEVYLKVHFQNFFDEELRISAEHILSIRSLLTLIEVADGIPEKATSVLALLPAMPAMLKLNKDFENYFIEGFNFSQYKEMVTLQFELLIWSLYMEPQLEVRMQSLASDVPVKSDNEDRLKDLEELGGKPKFNLADYTITYLKNRFQMNEEQLAIHFLTTVENINKGITELNQQMADTDGAFRIQYELKSVK